MKKVLCLVVFALCIANCDAATLKVCKKDLYTDCVSKLGVFFTVATGAGSYGYTLNSGTTDTSQRTWQWRPSTNTPSSGYDDSATNRVDGIHLCSSTNKPAGSGDYPIGNPSPTNGQYCWCKMTKINGTACPGVWVFQGNAGSASYCAVDNGGYGCASSCAVQAYGNGSLRAAVLALP